MPGFKLGMKAVSSGSNPTASVVPVLSYAWIVPTLFEESLINRKAEIYLRDCTLPEPTFEVETYESASIKLKFAKKMDWGDVKVTFYDTDTVLETIQKWYKKVWTAGTGIQPASNYKKDTKIQLLNMDDTALGEWTMYGSWPKAVSFSQLTYTSSDMHSVTVAVTYDWAKYE